MTGPIGRRLDLHQRRGRCRQTQRCSLTLRFVPPCMSCCAFWQSEGIAVESIVTGLFPSSQSRSMQHSLDAGIDLNVFRLGDYGIPYGYSTLLVASESFLECANPTALRSPPLCRRCTTAPDLQHFQPAFNRVSHTCPHQSRPLSMACSLASLSCSVCVVAYVLWRPTTEAFSSGVGR